MSIGGSKSSQKPVDMTPQSFRDLQDPFAAVMANLLGVPGQYTHQQQLRQQQQQQQGQNAWGGGKVTNWDGGGGPNDQWYEPGMDRSLSPGFFDGTPYASQPLNANGQPMGQGGQQPLALPPEAMKLYASMSSNPNIGTDAAFLGLPVWQGPYAAAMTGNEAATLQQLMAMQPGMQGDNEASNAFLRSIISGETGLTPTYGPDANPFMQAAIDAAIRPIQEGLTQQLTRELPGRFTQAGQFIQPQGSSAFDRAAALASTGAANAMTDAAGEISFQATEAERQRQFQAQELAMNRRMEAVGQQSGLQTAQIDNALKNLQAQSLPRLIQESGIERGLAQFNQQVQTLMQLLQIAGAITSPVISTEGKSSSFSLGLM